MIQASTRPLRHDDAREARHAAKLERKSFAIANRKREAEGRQPKTRDERKQPKHASFEHLLLAQDTGKLGQFSEKELAPFLNELRRRANIINKRKMKRQLGIGKYWPAGKHKNCDKKGISPKRFTGEIVESEAA